MKSKKETPPKLSDQEQVSAHIKKLEPGFSKLIETLRQIILSTDNSISERIKWNNPSFYYSGEMKPFDPKEYKREIIVFNLFKERMMLVFPSGAKLNDPTRLLEGDYKDGRRTVELKDLEDILAKKNALQRLIKEWLSLVDSD